MNQRSTTPTRYEFGLQYIAGEWRQGRSSAVIRDTNPYNGETLLEMIGASVADVDEAYDAAERAQSSWADMAPRDRAEVLRNAADLIEDRRDEIIEATIREVGGVRAFAEIIWYFAWSITAAAADYPARIRGEILPTDVPGQESRVYRKPLGVITVISPWNSPINLTLRSLAPALAVGNAVVVKPASDTPITGGLMYARIFEEAGLPKGLLKASSWASPARSGMRS